MSRIDEELARAVEESEADEAARPVQVDRSEEPAKRRSLGLLVALLVMGGGILALVMTSFEDSAIYSKGVDEVLAKKGELMDRRLRVQGTLVKGTLRRRDEPCEYRFAMQKNGQQIEVRYPQCVVPDTFRDVPEMDVQVTATGTLAAAGYLEASQIMAKCPSKYEMKERRRNGEQAPHGPMGSTLPAAAAVN